MPSPSANGSSPADCRLPGHFLAFSSRFARVIASAACLLLSSATALQAAKAKTVPFNVAPQPMPLALMILARQGEVEILFSYDELKGLQAPKVSGKLTTEQALAAILKGTPYAVQRHPVRTRSYQIMSPQMVARAEAEAKKPIIRVTDLPPELPPPPPPSLPVADSSIDRPRTPDEATPYVVFEGRTVEQSGALTVGDFLAERLSASNGSNLGGDVGMRGMGNRYTKFLINGREQPDVANVPDTMPGMNYRTSRLALLPLSSIQRIEVIPQSAAVAAGGGSIGGAINVVTRRDYSGGEITLGYENSFDTDSANKKAELRFGTSFNDNRTRLMVFAGATNSNSLAVEDRYDLVRDYATRATTGTPGLLNGTEILFGTTPRVDTTDGSNLVLKTGDTLGAPFVFMPANFHGLEQDGPQPIIDNAGKIDPESPDTAQAYLGRRLLLNRRPSTQYVRTEVRHAMTSYAEAYLDLSYERSTRNQAMGILSSNQYVTVPVGVPTNPFGQEVRVRFPYAPTGSNKSTREHQSATLGALFSLPQDWKARLEYSYGMHRSVDISESASSAAFQTAINNGTINVFDTSIINSDLLADHIQARTGRGNVEQLASTARIEGRLPTVFSITPELSGGYKARKVIRDTFRIHDGTTQSGILPTTVSSFDVFGELTIPVFEEQRNLPGLRLLEIVASASRDKQRVDSTVLKTNGSQSVTDLAAKLELEKAKSNYASMNPVVSVRYKPVQDLMLRASYSTGYLPTADYLLLPQLTATGSITDPKRGNSTYDTSITSGGNSEVNPEHSDTLSAGVVYTPEAVPGFRISVDLTDSRREDAVDILATSTLLAYEDVIPGRIFREAVAEGDEFSAGKITKIDASAIALYAANLKAWDLTIGYKKDVTGIGTFDLSAMYTLNSRYEQQLVPGGPFADLVNSPLYSGPFRDKASVSLVWARGPVGAGWSVRYHSRYKGLESSSITPTQMPDINYLAMSARTYHDAFVRYRFSTQSRGVMRFLDKTELLFGVRNMFGADPLFDASAPADLFLSGNGELRRASYYLSLKREF
ncbi:MAG: TonB-dependent receptor [Opitutaceae bacterium]|nr:TonB-dependent receptor [Opitutaceae bacterium]